MSSKNLNKTSVGQKSVILSFLFFTFILFSTSYAFSIFGVSFFEEKKENESTSSIQTFKGLNVKDSTEEEIKIKEKKEGIGQNLQNSNLALTSGHDLVTEIVDSNEGGKGSTDNEMTIYEVKKGDTLAGIAAYFEIDKQSIVTLNNETMNDSGIEEGDVLQIPPVSGIGYQVKKGDTLAGIAKKYNLDSEDISLFNGLIESEELSLGDTIYLPGAKLPKEDKIDLKIKDKNLAKDSKNKKDDKNSKNKDKSKDNKIVIGKFDPSTEIPAKTSSDVSAIVKLKKEGRNYSSLPKLAGYFIFPAPGAVRTQKMHGHNGADLANKIGSPILASAGGTVVVARDTGWNYGYGKYIVISHPNGTQTVYGHLSALNVAVGQYVDQGQRIASMGNTGNSTGPHVHFEVRGAYNPFAW
jgi:murein DD-endopeptidase MepM/ murein hydrolase activator NlpD